jgi:hypothetical protein
MQGARGKAEMIQVDFYHDLFKGRKRTVDLVLTRPVRDNSINGSSLPKNNGSRTEGRAYTQGF